MERDKYRTQVAKWVMRALDMGVEALRAEYRSLARYTMPDVTYEAFKINHEAGRNRLVYLEKKLKSKFLKFYSYQSLHLLLN